MPVKIKHPVMIRRCKDGDEAAMSVACVKIMPHWSPDGVCDKGPKFTRNRGGAPCVARIDDELTKDIVGKFAAHPACKDLGIKWFPDMASVVGYTRVEFEEFG